MEDGDFDKKKVVDDDVYFFKGLLTARFQTANNLWNLSEKKAY